MKHVTTCSLLRLLSEHSEVGTRFRTSSIQTIESIQNIESMSFSPLLTALTTAGNRRKQPPQEPRVRFSPGMFRELPWNASLKITAAIVRRKRWETGGLQGLGAALLCDNVCQSWEMAFRVLTELEPSHTWPTLPSLAVYSLLFLCVRDRQWALALKLVRGRTFPTVCLDTRRLVALHTPASWTTAIELLTFSPTGSATTGSPSLLEVGSFPRVRQILDEIRFSRGDWRPALNLFAHASSTSLRKVIVAPVAHILLEAEQWQLAVAVVMSHHYDRNSALPNSLARVLLKAALRNPHQHWRIALELSQSGAATALRVLGLATKWVEAVCLFLQAGPDHRSYSALLDALAPSQRWVEAIAVLCMAYSAGRDRGTVDPGYVRLCECLQGFPAPPLDIYGAARFAQISSKKDYPQHISKSQEPYRALTKNELLQPMLLRAVFASFPPPLAFAKISLEDRTVVHTLVTWLCHDLIEVTKRESSPPQHPVAWKMTVLHDLTLHTILTTVNRPEKTCSLLSHAVSIFSASPSQWYLAGSLLAHLGALPQSVRGLDRHAAASFMRRFSSEWKVAVCLYSRFPTCGAVVRECFTSVLLAKQPRILLNMLLLCPRFVLLEELTATLSDYVMLESKQVLSTASSPTLWWLTLRLLTKATPEVRTQSLRNTTLPLQASIVDGCLRSGAGWAVAMAVVCTIRSYQKDAQVTYSIQTQELLRQHMKQQRLAALQQSCSIALLAFLRDPSLDGGSDRQVHEAVLRTATTRGMWLQGLKYALRVSQDSLDTPVIRGHLTDCIRRIARWSAEWEQYGHLVIAALCGEWSRVLQSFAQVETAAGHRPRWLQDVVRHSDKQLKIQCPPKDSPRLPLSAESLGKTEALETFLTLCWHERKWEQALHHYHSSFQSGIPLRPVGLGLLIATCEESRQWVMALRAAAVLGPRHGYSDRFYLSTLRACVSGAQWLQSYQVISQMTRVAGFGRSEVPPEALALAMASCLHAGQWLCTLRLFDFHKDNTRHHPKLYEGAMSACIATGLWSHAIFLFHKMVNTTGPLGSGPSPNLVHVLIRACRGVQMDCVRLSAVLQPLYTYVEELHLMGGHQQQHVTWAFYLHNRQTMRLVYL